MQWGHGAMDGERFLLDIHGHLLALVVLGVVYIIQAVSRKSGLSRSEESSLDILKNRYAKGETTKEEFN